MSKSVFDFLKNAFYSLILSTISLTSVAQNTIIKAGHLFDSKRGKFLDNQVIIVKEGRVLQIGSNLKYDKNDIVIDLSQSWVLP